MAEIIRPHQKSSEVLFESRWGLPPYKTKIEVAYTTTMTIKKKTLDFGLSLSTIL